MNTEDPLRPNLYASLFQPLGKIQELLDVGCGKGPMLERCKERGIFSRGIDQDQDSVNFCKSKGFTAEKADLWDLLKEGPGDSTPDVWALCHLIEHFSPTQAQEIISGIARWLPANGRLALVTPNSKNLGILSDSFWRDPTHVRPYPRALLMEMGLKAGLETSASGIDEAAAPQGLSKLANGIRRWIVGDYFSGPDAFVIFKKSS